jgi:hypothetical protein
LTGIVEGAWANPIETANAVAPTIPAPRITSFMTYVLLFAQHITQAMAAAAKVWSLTH